jgi:toxin ParE1/3/4
MAEWEVLLTSDAEDDIETICDYVQTHDSAAHAEHVFSQIKTTILSLKTAPSRGRAIPELKGIGVSEYREVFFKPYRILYFIERRRVFVFAVFDGRRSIEELLQRRLLGAK